MEFCTRALDSKGYLFPPINPIDNFLQHWYPKYFNDSTIKTKKEYQQLKRRLRYLPTMIWDIKQLLKHGIAQSMTYSSEALKGLDEKLEKLNVQQVK